jgi:transposase
MNATTVAVDLAKRVFELAGADERWNVIERARFTRRQFERWFHNRAVRLGDGGMRYRAPLGEEAARPGDRRLLPAKYVRAYVKRNKTDAAGALALLEAVRGSDITPVGVKSVEQQALQGLHRLRSG